MERPGCILITPPKTSSYWNFSGNPLVLHLSIPCRHFRDLTGIDGPELQALLIEAARFPIDDQLLSQLTSRMWASLETRSEEHPTELQSLMRISYAVFCLTKKITLNN